MANGDTNQFGYIYDWMDNWEIPDYYTQYSQDDLLKQVYDEVTAGLDDPMDFEHWKEQYGRFVDEYNPVKEELKEDAFKIKVDNTEKLFNLKTENIEKSHDLIKKYNSIDDSDDFESVTEMSIRHLEEDEKMDRSLNRMAEITKGKKFIHKLKDLDNKQIKNTLRSGDQEALIDSVKSAFWSDMKLARLKYDKKRLKRDQSLENLILESDQKLDKASLSKSNKLDTLLVSTKGKIENAALDLIEDKMNIREDFSDDLWGTITDLAADDAFVKGECDGCSWTWAKTRGTRKKEGFWTSLCRSGGSPCPSHCCGADLSTEEYLALQDEYQSEHGSFDEEGNWIEPEGP